MDGDLKAVCKYCGLQLQTKSGTSSLRGHIAESCPAIEDDVRKSFIATMKKQPSGGFVFDPQVCCDRMIKFCIHVEIPFRKFEDPYCQPWIDSMQPSFRVKGHQTLRSDFFKKYEEMKRDLQLELHNLNSSVCITFDMWMSSQDLRIHGNNSSLHRCRIQDEEENHNF
uniref:BED-type domain-containing protein n=1 Tax=Arundo donax TaxID=35708 RepID=A0A0A9D4M3_ARUDO